MLNRQYGDALASLVLTYVAAVSSRQSWTFLSWPPTVSVSWPSDEFRHEVPGRSNQIALRWRKSHDAPMVEMAKIAAQ